MASRSDLTLIVPSKNRPDNVARLLKNVPEEVEVLVGMTAANTDIEYDYLDLRHSHNNCLVMRIPDDCPPGAVAAANALWAMAASPYVAFLGDDHLPQGDRWVEQVLTELKRIETRAGVAMVYGDDGLMHSTLPTAIFMSLSIPTTLGWLAPPCLRHLYMDNFWLDLGRETATIGYLPGLKINHLHPHADVGVPWDATYEEASTPNMHRDRDFYELYKKYDFPGDVEKIRGLLK